jgi:D-threo-aldose 1-dehydrogenase
VLAHLFKDVPALNPVYDFSYDGVMRSVEESLERLGVERVDVLHVHDPDDHLEEALAGAYPALDRLRAEGAIGAVGAGMTQTPALVRLAQAADFDCFLLAGRYTLLDHGGLTELLPLCEQRGISLIVGGVYNSGILADPAPGATFDYAQAPPALLERARRLHEVCARHGVPLKAAAIQFPLGHPAVASVLTGCRSAAELEENVRMFETPIPADLWAELRAEDLLAPDVPVPGERGAEPAQAIR